MQLVLLFNQVLDSVSAHPDLLAQIGALLGNEDPGAGERAASVLIGGVNNATRGSVDRAGGGSATAAAGRQAPTAAVCVERQHGGGSRRG